MKRHPTRTVTIGNFIRLANAFDKGSTMQFWYYMWLGNKWYPFDIRDVARKANVELPNTDVSSGLNREDFEEAIREVLEGVATWCKTIRAQDYITR